MHGQSGWSFGSDIGPNQIIEGVATRTDCGNGDTISGWIPNTAQQKRKPTKISGNSFDDKNLPLKKRSTDMSIKMESEASLLHRCCNYMAILRAN